MNEQVLIAIIGLVGVVIGAAISSASTFIQDYRNHQRWLIEKRIAYLKGQIEEIDQMKKRTLKDLQNLFAGKKFGESGDFVASVPMEVIDVFKKHLPNGEKVMIQNLSEAKKQEILIDAATALEEKKIELKANIKKLIT